jgi:hypothetical protein
VTLRLVFRLENLKKFLGKRYLPFVLFFFLLSIWLIKIVILLIQLGLEIQCLIVTLSRV